MIRPTCSRKATWSAALVVGSIISLTPLADAAVIIEQPGDHRLRNDGNYAVGFVFTVDASDDISVTALGIYDAPNGAAGEGEVGDGLLRATGVAIYEVSQHPDGADGNGRNRFVYEATIIPATGEGAVAVPAGDAGNLVNNYRYVSLETPIILENGKMYQIMAGYAAGQDKYINYDGGEDGSNITHVASDDFIIDTTATFVSNTSDPSRSTGGSGGRVGDPYSGPNFQYSVVPEPASLALLGLGGLLMVTRGRRADDD